MTVYRLDYALQQAADLVAKDMTPARREGFQAGAAWFAQVFAEAGLQGAVGTNIREVVDQLRRAKQGADETLSRFDAVSFDAEVLDARARATLALTAALLTSFTGALAPPSTGAYVRATDDRTGQQIARAVSYIVWAYLAKDDPPPFAHDDPDPLP